MAMEESRRALAGLLSPHRVMPGVPSQRQISKVLYIYIYGILLLSFPHSLRSSNKRDDANVYTLISNPTSVLRTNVHLQTL